MKAAQRFMRPVKEIREGFVTMDVDDQCGTNSNVSAERSSSSHAVSATRHFVEQYRSRAAQAGLISSSSPRSTARSSIMLPGSRAGSPRRFLPDSGVTSSRAFEPATTRLPAVSWLEAGQSGKLQGAASLSHHQPV